jgi:GNAT superfamily N-acetyltransferase
VRVADALLAAQAARFERLDPMLPPALPPPEGGVLTAALPDGERVAGVVVHGRYDAGSAPTLWSAMETWELYPLIGATGGTGMEAVLREWRRLLDRLSTGADSACVVTWPSRDAEAVKSLLAHGFTPLSTLAVRRAPVRDEPSDDLDARLTPVLDDPPNDLAVRRAPVHDAPPNDLAEPPNDLAEPPNDLAEPPDDLAVRLATMRDLEVALELELAELEYSALVGAAVDRPDAREVKLAALTRHLEQGDPVWLAERDGLPVGLAHCRLLDADPGSVSATRLRAGRWGYVNCLSVRAEARGAGVGRRLMAVAHRELERLGAAGTFLYYNPPNPLAPVFWARQGYRPLWTIWEVRPAGALR